MVMEVRCAKCGAKLRIIRKAMPKYSTIVNLALYHECKGVADFEQKIDPLPAPITSGNDEFIQKLNSLQPQPPIIDDIRPTAVDLRDSDKNSAPLNLLDQLKRLKST